jgi:hypothetical protein
MTERRTLPVEDDAAEPDTAVIVAATYKDPQTGALYVHSDLVKAAEPWADETHIPPPKADEKFGDVESWAEYVKAFAVTDNAPFLTWSSQGLRAVLDYHEGIDSPGRLQWTAAHPFQRSPEWEHWRDVVAQSPWGHKRAVERLEDLSEDITEPVPSELMNLLRNLRTTVNANAQTELLPDGTTRVGFVQDKAVRSISDVALPPEIHIAIPILKGHDVRYKLAVRLRASVDDQAHLTLRFSIPNAERVLEAVYADQVAMAKTLLGMGYLLLRAAG